MGTEATRIERQARLGAMPLPIGSCSTDLVGVDDRHPRHQDLHGLAVLALLGPGDELVAPAHDLADVGKAEELELADDLQGRELGALSPGAHDLRDAGPEP